MSESRMRPLTLAASVLVAIACPGWAADKPLHLTHDWRVSIDAAGKVVALKDDGRLSKAVSDPVEHAIREWTFEPGRIDGSRAPTETTLTLDLGFVPAANDTYSVRVRDARVGGVIESGSSRAFAPKMPRDAAVKPGLRARVVVKADYDANGTITGVEVQPDLDIGSMPSLDAATVEAVRHWKVLPERVGEHGVPSSVMIPVCYTVTEGWPRPEDSAACAWLPPDGRSPVGNGQSYAVAPATRLVSDVIGHAL
jgi:TonB family protein